MFAEFLRLASNTDFTESDLEKSILSNLQKFLMELGKGYAFVARQQHIHTEKQDYFKEELRKEIETRKAMFYLQQKERD